MNATAESTAQPLSAPGLFWKAITALPRDGSFRFSVKFGIAGIIAVFAALFNKSHEPTWALFTVFVLMVAQYIGAIEEKSILRVVGTVIGGVVGYLLTASFEQDPLIYFSLLGLFVAATAAMFGQARYPYAFLLCAMTAVVVCSNGMGHPEMSWQFMIWRIQEVCIGILAVLLVQSLLWPRYAADEFLTGLRGAFLDLRDLFSNTRSGTPANGAAIEARLNQLRQLLRFGGRESSYFRSRIETYVELLAIISRIHGAIRPLAGVGWKNSFYLENAGQQLVAVHEAIEAQLTLLGAPKQDSAELRQGSLDINAAMDALKHAIIDLRRDPRSRDVELDDILGISLECLSLEEIHQELARSFDLLDGLPVKTKKRHALDLHWLVPGVPPAFWITNGIRSAISLVAAMVLMNWVHPPGGATMVLCAWLFCYLLPISPEGRGDQRAWHVVVAAIPCVLFLCLGLILGSPLLSSYAVLNILIFTWMFVYGQVAYRTAGVSTVMNISMMGLVGVMGLNAQEPVSFQAIADIFFGISIGTVIAAVFQRTLWPLLPQREMRDRFQEMLRIQREALVSGTPSLEGAARLSQLPSEIKLRLANLVRPVYSEAEIQNLCTLLDHLDRFTANRIWESDPGQAKDGLALTKKIRELFAEILEKIGASFSTGRPCSVDAAPLRAAIVEFDAWVLDARLQMMSESADPSVTTNLIGRAARYQNAATNLMAAAEVAAQLDTALYSKDNAL
jgi:uncharacterized membrane protein YccC